jgi:NAD(P)-dependent dehydrogenase (short-subunit alcohol dehydrogenase family)
VDVSGKVCVVTGGARGIGKALVEALHKAGASFIAVVDLHAEEAEAVAATVDGRGFGLDVRSESQIRGMVEAVEAHCGHIDLFCSNAGIIGVDGDPWWACSAPDDQWQRMWEIHVMAHVYAARACLPRMIERGEGYFLHTVSAAGLLSQIGTAPYAVTKHAAIGFAESLSITHGDQGIKVSCLCPQAVDTAMIQGSDNGGVAGLDGVLPPEAVAEKAIEGLREEKFLILPHPQVEDYRQAKAANYDRWLGGMRKLRRMFGGPTLG